MKSVLRLIGILLTICVLAVGFYLPDMTLGLIDGGSAKVQTEELPSINLDMKREFSLHEKLSIANTVLPSVEITRNQASSEINDITDKIQAFMNDLIRTIGITENAKLSFFYEKPFIYYSYDARESVVFWHIYATIEEKCYLQFVVDDTSLEVLAFTLKTVPESSLAAARMDPYMAVLFDSIANSFKERFGGEIVNRKSVEGDMQDGVPIVHEISEELLITAEDESCSYFIYGDPQTISFGSPYDPFINYDGHPKVIEEG